MRLYNQLINRFSVPGFMLNSVPKAGSHLLGKAVPLFPGIRYGRLSLHFETVEQFKLEDSGSATILVGVDNPQPVSLAKLKQSLEEISRGHKYFTGHIPFSPKMATLLGDLKMKSLLIIRDPRDLVVSHANFIASREDHFLSGFYRSLSAEDRITKSIDGIIGESGVCLLQNIDERYRSVLGWNAQPFNCMLRFENLIGPEGGGDRFLQMEELRKITHHLKIHHDSGDIQRVAQQLFGGTRTFRKGQIGSWREAFLSSQRELFKRVAGQLLVDLDYEDNLDW